MDPADGAEHIFPLGRFRQVAFGSGGDGTVDILLTVIGWAVCTNMLPPSPSRYRPRPSATCVATSRTRTRTCRFLKHEQALLTLLSIQTAYDPDVQQGLLPYEPGRAKTG